MKETYLFGTARDISGRSVTTSGMITMLALSAGNWDLIMELQQCGRILVKPVMCLPWMMSAAVEMKILFRIVLIRCKITADQARRQESNATMVLALPMIGVSVLPNNPAMRAKVTVTITATVEEASNVDRTTAGRYMAVLRIVVQTVVWRQPQIHCQPRLFLLPLVLAATTIGVSAAANSLVKRVRATATETTSVEEI